MIKGQRKWVSCQFNRANISSFLIKIIFELFWKKLYCGSCLFLALFRLVRFLLLNFASYLARYFFYFASYFFFHLVPTPLEGGGRNYILKWIFFVQSILAGRYIHRRELRLVSLESLSSVEYGIKKIFLIFFRDREISRFKLSRK